MKRFLTDRIITVEWFKGLDAIQRGRVSYPLNGLPIRDQPDVVHGDDSIKESFKAFLVMGCREPRSVVVQWERRPVMFVRINSYIREQRSKWCVPVGGVMALKVLDQHLVHSLSIWRVAATVTHGASSSIQILPHNHGHFPNTWNVLNTSLISGLLREILKNN